MRFSPPEPEVVLYETGFGGADILGRHRSAKALSDLVERVEDPLVVAFNGKWGTGKTHFLKRWVGAHEIENGGHAKTVYFDAFLHDYMGDPLPALVSALSERCPSAEYENIKKLKKIAFRLAKPISRIGAALATYGATEVLSGMGDAIATSVGGEVSSSLEKYWDEHEAKRSAMFAFQEALSGLVDSSSEESDGASVVFVIDELDRCRPDFSLELLEIIKHFFSVPRVHFILGVNLQALENSVRARYGGGIDATAYLKKFISIVFDLPAESGSEHRTVSANFQYFSYLATQMGIPSHLSDRIWKNLKMVSRGNDVSLREIGKIASSVSLLDESVLANSNWLEGWLEVLVDLIVSSVVRPDLHSKFLEGVILDDELKAYFGITPNMLEQTIGDELNSGFDIPSFWKLRMWQYITSDGSVDFGVSQENEHVSRLFDRFGSRNARRLPMAVHRKWLDNLNFYSE
jgi:hypothetical protein